jgi:hypothetical protein
MPAFKQTSSTFHYYVFYPFLSFLSFFLTGHAYVRKLLYRFLLQILVIYCVIVDRKMIYNYIARCEISDLFLANVINILKVRVGNVAYLRCRTI